MIKLSLRWDYRAPKNSSNYFKIIFTIISQKILLDLACGTGLIC